MTNPLIYQLGITMLPGIGHVTAKTLISYCGSVQNVFQSTKKHLLKIPSVGEKTANAILENKHVLDKAAEEVQFIKANDIKPLFFFDEAYPQRLKNCIDAPLILFYKGNANLNKQRIISIVGTRRATTYGKSLCNKLIEFLKPYNVMVVSGLAYGIDIAAHKACLQHNVPTIGVLAHGLDRIYPPTHSEVAKDMQQNGGIVTEFLSTSQPDRENFPKRNRIIAGMSDATIIVETAAKGGSMITANLAIAYNKDVFAFPGRTTDPYSKGANYLIKKNMAALIESGEDLVHQMGWEQNTDKHSKAVQAQLFVNLAPNEQAIVDCLRDANGELAIDTIGQKVAQSPSAIAANLLSLELKGIVAAKAGSRYCLV